MLSGKTFYTVLLPQKTFYERLQTLIEARPTVSFLVINMPRYSYILFQKKEDNNYYPAWYSYLMALVQLAQLEFTTISQPVFPLPPASCSRKNFFFAQNTKREFATLNILVCVCMCVVGVGVGGGVATRASLYFKGSYNISKIKQVKTTFSVFFLIFFGMLNFFKNLVHTDSRKSGKSQGRWFFPFNSRKTSSNTSTTDRQRHLDEKQGACIQCLYSWCPALCQ